MSNQPERAEPIGKIIAGSEGLGTVTPEMVEERATQLARMDGRTEPNQADRDRAREELQGPTAPDDPEDDARQEQLVTWDEAPGAVGGKVPEVAPYDDSTISETLIQEGLDEAEHDQRVSASEENPPEEEI